MVKDTLVCVKYLLGIFNFITLIFGILLIIHGSQSLPHNEYVRHIVKTPDGSSMGAVVVGVIISIISFLGCCGAFTGNRCMLISFSILMLIVIAVELSLGFAFLSFNYYVATAINDNLEKSMINYKSNEKNDTNTMVVDGIQSNLKCCGVNNAEDWIGWNKTMPISCCPNVNDIDGCYEDYAWSDGCAKPLNKIVHESYSILSVIAITVAFIQILGLLFAGCLAFAAHRGYTSVK